MEARHCYYVRKDIVSGEFVPCIAVENDHKVHPTDWTWGTDFELAQDCADKKNQRLGLSPSDVIAIIWSTSKHD